MCVYSQIILSEHFTTNKERKITESCCFLLLVLHYGSLQLFPTIENEKCAVLNDIRFEGFFLHFFFLQKMYRNAGFVLGRGPAPLCFLIH